jgi:hypothetical protein
MSSKWVELKGVQRPRSLWVPPCVTSSGDEAVEVCAMGGLYFDPWQEFCFRESLGERANGTWAAMEVGLEVPRQNGKGGFLEGRQLAGLFLFEEGLQVHSAHQFDTSLEAFRRLLTRIEETPDFDREVMRVSKSHGEEGIELRGNRRIRFRTRTSGGGRGFSGDVLYLDEAMIIKEATHGALLPVLSARPNPQIFYTGSAVDEEQHEDGVVFARVRERGLAGNDPRLAWFGFGEPSDITPDSEEALAMLDDPEVLAQANPALGIRITRDFVEAERRTLTSRNFAVERLSIGAWPSTKETADELFSRVEWEALQDCDSTIEDAPTLAIDVSPNRKVSTIAASGRTADDHFLVEVVDRRSGTGWVVDRVVELVGKHGVLRVVLDKKGPAGSLLEELEEKLPFEVTVVTTEEYVQACGNFFDSVPQKTTRHGGQPELDAAVRGAATRPLGEASAWSRKKSEVDITALVACTLARWGAAQGEESSVYNESNLLVLD